MFQANLPKSFPPLIHNIDLGVEILEVGGVREAILDVDFGVDQRSVPKKLVFIK